MNQSNYDQNVDQDNQNLSKNFEGSLAIDTNAEKPSNNVKNHINIVEQLHEESVQELLSIKRDAEVLRQEVHLMRENVLKYIEAINNFVTPTAEHLMKEIKNNINVQKEENSSLQVQITELRKENSVLQQIILASAQKLAKLEGVVGSYRDQQQSKVVALALKFLLILATILQEEIIQHKTLKKTQLGLSFFNQFKQQYDQTS